MQQRSRNNAVLLVLAVALLASSALACNSKGDCDACKKLPLVKKAVKNMGQISALLKTKECESWRDYQFRTVAFSFKGSTQCRTFEGQPFADGEEGKCKRAEDFDLKIDEDIAIEAKTQVIDDLAREGQLECEPNGTMVFNRGKVQFAKLDSLFEPFSFLPLGFGRDAEEYTVGFEVFLHSELTSMGSPASFWCHKVKSAFMMIYDIVDADGNSVLPPPQSE